MLQHSSSQQYAWASVEGGEKSFCCFARSAGTQDKTGENKKKTPWSDEKIVSLNSLYFSHQTLLPTPPRPVPRRLKIVDRTDESNRNFQNMYCVVRGEKLFTLLPPSDVLFLYEQEYPSGRYRQGRDRRGQRRDFEVELERGTTVPWIPVGEVFAQSRPLALHFCIVLLRSCSASSLAVCK